MEKFQTYVAEVAAQAVNTQAEDIEGFMAEKWALDPSMTVKEKLSSMISIIGENMNIRRFAKVSEEKRYRCFLHPCRRKDRRFSRR